MNRAMRVLGIAILALIAVSIFNGAFSARSSEVVLSVTGLTSDQAAAKVEKALTRVEGVKSVKADVQSQTATIRFDESKIDALRLIEVVENLGDKEHSFRARLVGIDSGSRTRRPHCCVF